MKEEKTLFCWVLTLLTRWQHIGYSWSGNADYDTWSFSGKGWMIDDLPLVKIEGFISTTLIGKFHLTCGLIVSFFVKPLALVLCL